MSSAQRTAIVLGAGIQGTCAALALATDGWQVTLIDRGSRAFVGASGRGEGKIHLGYVYANESAEVSNTQAATARLMVEGALTFAPAIDAWLGSPVDWRALCSSPFHYAVPESTMVDAGHLSEHYARVDDLLAAQLASDPECHYLGLRALRPAARSVAAARHYSAEITDVFETAELAIEPQQLAAVLSGGLTAAGVQMRFGYEVQGVERSGHGFGVHVRTADVHPAGLDHIPPVLRADIVVNCLWEERMSIDRTLGIAPPRTWTYRLKYGVVGELPADPSSAEQPAHRLPSTTFVLGPFGDTVVWESGRTYLSWYPVGLAGLSTEPEIPEGWRAAIAGAEPAEHRMEIAERTVEGIAALLPGVRAVVPAHAAAGVIVAWGETDIDDPASALHGRSAIGVSAHDGYFSIDTGKFTTAPLFARQLVAMVR